MAEQPPLTRAHVLNVVLTYAAVASLWILLSDKAVEWLFSTPAQFALSWMLSRKPWIAPVPGTTNPAHLDDFLGGASVRLSEPELKEFDLACSRIPLMGHRADPFTESQIDK